MVAAQLNAGGGKKRLTEKVRRKRSLRPPWRNLLGGKPIERQFYYFNERRDLGKYLGFFPPGTSADRIIDSLQPQLAITQR